MDLKTGDVIKKKLLDAQENVRDYEMFSKKVDNEEVSSTFKKFAEESGMHARKLQELVDKYGNIQ
ncbi:ferritin family protein [Anaeromicrobium sediminis]|uniref:Uncharacterized protein n=1 Tax=Anaeromicrobium sediminis TaxID=1478221 RepID=A0A267MI34_9FIRM|nr:ferritin family protein [Anaeromicrobium sediminis]PAB59072.1 hypothetical protein CCE28_11170 [Anaeromicrobium sediminis]